MKKLLSFTLLLGLFALPAFLHAQKAPTPVKSSRILIAYYSWSGNTKSMAQTIQKAVGGTLFEIQCVNPYPKDFKSCVAASKKDIKKGTPIKAFPDVKKYDVIFIGSPNWFGTIAPPVRTFLNNKALEKKVILPFITHGKGGMQNCERDVKNICKKSIVRKAIAHPGKEVKKADRKIDEWVTNELKVIK